MSWRRAMAAGAHAVDGQFDRLRFGLKQRLGLLHRFEILPYRGYGTPRELFLKGRVLEESGITRSGHYDTVWDNLRNMGRRFASDEEGFFDVRLELPEPLTGPTMWHPVELALLHRESPGGEPVRSTGQALVPSAARMGIISDIDDTVVHSRATSVPKMAWIVLLNNAHTRAAYRGRSRLLRRSAARRGRPRLRPDLLRLQ